MEHLPQLDITEDLELLAKDDNLDVSIVSEDLSKPIGPSKPQDIFVGKPTNNNIKKTPKQIETQKEEIIVKKGNVNIMDDENKLEETKELIKVKKPLSDKQKAHLAKIRVKALEAKKEKARLKKEVKERVEIEVREKRGRKKKVQIVEKDVSDKATEQFAQQINKPLPKPAQPEYNFNNFMSHMEKYQRMQYDYQMRQLEITKKTQDEQLRKEEAKKQADKKKLDSQMAQLKYQQSRLNNKALPTPKLPTTIQPQKPKNPYDEFFSW